jgi:predicted O-methyltransferase YrrM
MWVDRLTADARPELTPRAIDELRSLCQGRDVLECGSGGSTIFLSRYANSLITLEHDQSWYDGVRRWINGRDSVRQELMPFKTFSRYIDELANGSLDVAFVDCRNVVRMGCVKSAMPKVKDGGYVVVDDVQWPALAGLWDLLEGWEWYAIEGMVHRLSGEIRPGKTGFWKR